MSKLSRRSMLIGGAAIGGVAVAGQSSAQRAPHEHTAPAIDVRPGDPQYADLTRGWNQRWVGSPERIRIVGSTAQVVAAVGDAVRSGKRVAVRSGGFCFEDFVANADVQVVIDMAGMNAVTYDPARRAIAVEAGALVAETHKATFGRWGVVIPTGICQNVGMGGHVSGGAYGALNRLHGLAVDHLYAVEVVVVDRFGMARPVVATGEPDDPNRDLWWAHTGGGGGNFGVVTKYWFRTPGASGSDPRGLLPRPPSEVILHSQVWPWPDMKEEGFYRLVHNANAWFQANSGADSPYNSLFSHLRLTHKGAGALALAAQMDATRPDSEQLLAEFTAAIGEGIGVAPRPSQHRRVPWLHAVWWGGMSGMDHTVRAKFKSAYLRTGFTDSQIAGIWRNVTRDDYSHNAAQVQIASYGGAVNTVAPSATAVPQRDSVMKVMWAAAWQNATDDDRHIAWLRECYRDTFADTGGVPVPNETTDGCFVNYADIDLNDPQWNTSGVPWHDLYYGGNYRRLQRAKARWDPRNVFRHKQSITA